MTSSLKREFGLLPLGVTRAFVYILVWISGDFQVLRYGPLRDPEVKIDRGGFLQSENNHFLLLHFFMALNSLSLASGQVQISRKLQFKIVES